MSSGDSGLTPVFDYLSGNLQAVIDQLKDGKTTRPEEPDFTLEAFWKRIGLCVKVVSQEATKMCLACSEPPLPSPQVLEPLVNGIEHSSLALVSAYYSLPVSRGQTLRKLVTDSVIGLISALQALIISLKANDSSSKRHLQSTGSVWEICDKFPKLPQDNRAAVLSEVSNTLELISDALEELEESLKNASGEVDELFDGCTLDEDDDTAPKVWSDSDRDIVAASLGIIKTAKATMSKLKKAIETKGHCNTVDEVTQLDDVSEKILTISPAVDELASSLYPPVKPDVISANSQRLVVELRQIINTVKCSHFADPVWIDFLNKAIDHNAKKVTDVIISHQ